MVYFIYGINTLTYFFSILCGSYFSEYIDSNIYSLNRLYENQYQYQYYINIIAVFVSVACYMISFFIKKIMFSLLTGFLFGLIVGNPASSIIGIILEVIGLLMVNFIILSFVAMIVKSNNYRIIILYTICTILLVNFIISVSCHLSGTDDLYIIFAISSIVMTIIGFAVIDIYLIHSYLDETVLNCDW